MQNVNFVSSAFVLEGKRDIKFFASFYRNYDPITGKTNLSLERKMESQGRKIKKKMGKAGGRTEGRASDALPTCKQASRQKALKRPTETGDPGLPLSVP